MDERTGPPIDRETGDAAIGGYPRFPHLHGELICFTAEDDLWIAPLPDPGPSGLGDGDGTLTTGRAWRLTVDRVRPGTPRFSPDGRHIAFTTGLSYDPEVYVADVDGGPARRLTHWAAPDTAVQGWDGDRVLATASHGQPFSWFTRAHRIPLGGGPGEELPWGPVSGIAVGPVPAGAPGPAPGASDTTGPIGTAGEAGRSTLLLTGKAPHEPAAWKRYRGGGTGRLWLDGREVLPIPRGGGHLDCPMLVGDRIAFLSDHEGVGNLYSCRPDGSELWRHTDHDAFYARHAATDGRRVIYHCGGDLWLVPELTPESRPLRLRLRLGGPRPGRRPRQVRTAGAIDALAVDTTGRASAVCVRGSLHWLTHRDGPARVISATPGARVRMPVMLGDTGRIVWVTDAAGEDALEVSALPRAGGERPPIRLATGRLGRVRELVAAPDGRSVAVASHDGRLLLVTIPDEAEEPEEPEGPEGPEEPGGAGVGPGSEAAGGPGAEDSPDGSGPEAGADAEAAGAARTGPGAGEGGEPGPETATGSAEPTGGPGAEGADGTPGPEGTPGADAAPGTGVLELIRSVNGPVRDLAFSPDSGHLAWAHPGVGRSLSRIKIARLSPGDRTILDVTDGRFEDEEPVFTRDGRYLAFLSWRGFDPVYDVHTGDLSFPLGCRPHLVPLSSATPSPFALTPEGRPAAGGLDPADAGVGGEEGAVSVEAEGLASRVTPFPVTASKYSSLRPVAGGGLVWLRWPISGALGETFADPNRTSGKPTLVHFDPARGRSTDLTGEVDWFEVSGDGTRLVVCEDEELRAVPATETADADSTVWLDVRRIVQWTDPPAEWRQAFDEAGRLVRDLFWEPGMCGIDWTAELKRYRPLLERVATPDEFADVLRETLGELGTSHAYVTPARPDEGPVHYRRPQGLLGADIEADGAGGWRVARILPGDSSDSRARSPLAGTGVREGAVLARVNGRPVDPVTGPWPLLAGTGGSTVELSFRDPDTDTAAGGEEGSRSGRYRRVAVVPLLDDRPLRYQDWVARRRRTVHELSGGRCGYVHIPDMGGSGWAQFTRDLRMEFSRQALVVDVRGNAGGHISELVVEKLTRTILGWDLTRNAQPVSYPSDAPRGPVVALANEATSSDGDMITAAFRLLGLGPVVGTRTWGGVVGMTGRHRLVDGTVITVPMNAAWFDALGWNVENHGVEPDVEAVRSPLEWADERPTVLEKAVRLALELLERRPAHSPPGYERIPDRRRPPLPPRGGSGSGGTGAPGTAGAAGEAGRSG
ncbi:S41 family peptidase [Streptomyces calidiresistens]